MPSPPYVAANGTPQRNVQGATSNKIFKWEFTVQNLKLALSARRHRSVSIYLLIWKVAERVLSREKQAFRIHTLRSIFFYVKVFSLSPNAGCPNITPQISKWRFANLWFMPCISIVVLQLLGKKNSIALHVIDVTFNYHHLPLCLSSLVIRSFAHDIFLVPHPRGREDGEVQRRYHKQRPLCSPFNMEVPQAPLK